MNKKLMTEIDLENEFGISRVTWRGWRFRKKGPKFIKLHGLVYYEREAVLEWYRSGREACASSGKAA
jgi:hypothetical protein